MKTSSHMKLFDDAINLFPQRTDSFRTESPGTRKQRSKVRKLFRKLTKKLAGDSQKHHFSITKRRNWKAKHTYFKKVSIQYQHLLILRLSIRKKDNHTITSTDSSTMYWPKQQDHLRWKVNWKFWKLVGSKFTNSRYYHTQWILKR